jgi:hypothetical protein
VQPGRTYLKMSFCVSDGRSRIVIFFFSEPCARLGSGFGEGTSLEGAIVVGLSLFELNDSNPIILKVRFQTSSPSNLVRGVEHFRRDDFPGRAGIVRARCDELRVRVSLDRLPRGV